jgi:hypothetical protein
MVSCTRRRRVIDVDLVAVLIGCSDLLWRPIAILGVELGPEKKRGRGYGAGHQDDLQALSHNRVAQTP